MKELELVENVSLNEASDRGIQKSVLASVLNNLSKSLNKNGYNLKANLREGIIIYPSKKFLCRLEIVKKTDGEETKYVASFIDRNSGTRTVKTETDLDSLYNEFVEFVSNLPTLKGTKLDKSQSNPSELNDEYKEISEKIIGLNENFNDDTSFKVEEKDSKFVATLNCKSMFKIELLTESVTRAEDGKDKNRELLSCNSIESYIKKDSVVISSHNISEALGIIGKAIDVDVEDIEKTNTEIKGNSYSSTYSDRLRSKLPKEILDMLESLNEDISGSKFIKAFNEADIEQKRTLVKLLFNENYGIDENGLKDETVDLLIDFIRKYGVGNDLFKGIVRYANTNKKLPYKLVAVAIKLFIDNGVNVFESGAKYNRFVRDSSIWESTTVSARMVVELIKSFISLIGRASKDDSKELNSVIRAFFNGAKLRNYDEIQQNIKNLKLSGKAKEETDKKEKVVDTSFSPIEESKLVDIVKEKGFIGLNQNELKSLYHLLNSKLSDDRADRKFNNKVIQLLNDTLSTKEFIGFTDV